jgi:hypothetical protein
MSNENEPRQTPPLEQIRDVRDLLTRLYREVGISAVAAALEVGKDKAPASHPPAAVLQTRPEKHGQAA